MNTNNINKIFYSINAFRGLMMGLFSPIWVLHLANNNISLLEIGLLGAVLETARLIFEIPSGIISDKYGEKLSVQLSCLTGAICWLLFTQEEIVFATCALAMIFLALSGSLLSGSFESWISKTNTIDSFPKILTRATQFMFAFFIVGSIASGNLFVLNSSYPFIISTITLIIMLFLASSLPRTKTLSTTHKETETFKQVITKSFKVIKTNRSVMVIMAAAFLINMSYDTLERYWQPFSVEKGFSEELLGYILAPTGLIAIFGLNLVKRVKNENGLILLAIFEILGIGLIVFIVYASGIPVIFAIAAFLSLGRIRGPAEQMILNETFPEKYKATLFSCVSGVGAAGEILAGIVFGFWVQYFGIANGFLVCAVILLISLLLLFTTHNSNGPGDKYRAQTL